MKYIYINITAKGESIDTFYGKVEDKIWEQYQNGEISAWKLLYEHYFIEHNSVNREYDVTEIEEIEED